jgi:tRNA threonylcarbamoyladenosine biosynthesis protein TsaB
LPPVAANSTARSTPPTAARRSPRARAQAFAAHVAAGTIIAGSGADLVVAALPMDIRPLIAHRLASPGIAALCRVALAAPPQAEAPRPLYLRAPDAKPQGAALIARR